MFLVQTWKMRVHVLRHQEVGGRRHALSSEAVDGTLFEISTGGGGRGDEGEWRERVVREEIHIYMYIYIYIHTSLMLRPFRAIFCLLQRQGPRQSSLGSDRDLVLPSLSSLCNSPTSTVFSRSRQSQSSLGSNWDLIGI